MNNNKQIIIGLVGLISSGKGTIADYLVKHYQGSTHRFSTMLRDVLSRLHLEINRHNMQTLSTSLRQNFGEELLAKVIANDVKDDKHKLIVVDGIRRVADIKYLQNLDNFILVRVEASEKLRYTRLIKRAENKGDSQKSFEEFIADHKKETELTIPEIMDKATITINNNGSIEDLYTQVDKLIKKL